MGTRYKGSVKERSALDTMIKLVRASESVLKATRGVYAARGLTESQFGVLEALLYGGPMTHQDLGKKILKTKGNMTMVIRHLKKDGLVTNLRGGVDRRRSLVELTPSGKALIKAVMPEHVRSITRVMAALKHSEQQHLGELCKRLGLANE